MTRLIIFFVVAALLFSGAAGVSWYMQGSMTSPENEEKERPAKDGHGAAHGKIVKLESPRPLSRPSSSPDADRISQMAANLQAQQDSLKNREQYLATREKQLDLIHAEIKNEHKKLDGVRKAIEAEMALVQEKLESLEKRAGETEKDRQKAEVQMDEIRRSTLEINNLEAKNLKQVASIYDKMDPAAAAQSIQQMAEKGKIDTAVTILANMRERAAANLLGELSKEDATIATQLFDRMRYMKAPNNAQK
jgi:flagellar motility protein MotE (MotC chaperone)